MKKILALALVALCGLAFCVAPASAQCVTASVVQSSFVTPFVVPTIQTQVVLGTPLVVAPQAVAFVNAGAVANVNVGRVRGLRSNVVSANVVGGGAVANVNIQRRGLLGRRNSISVQAVGGAGGVANVNVRGRR